LVKDGATAIETLGDSIDASLVDLKGGTTGQVLAKNSNTDMDFTWTAVDPLVILDAKGDLITATAADTPARLAVGANNTVLTADSSTSTGLKWAAAAGGGKLLQLVSATYATETDSSSTTYADTGLTATITPTSATSRIYVQITAPFLKNAGNASNGVKYRIMRGATEIAAWPETSLQTGTAINNSATFGLNYVDSPATTSATTYKLQFANVTAASFVRMCSGGSLATIQLLEIGA
jgi:hypothetical protein